MLSKKFSILIVPPDSSRVVNKEISQRLLVLCSLIISCLIVASIYSAIGFIKSSIDRQKMIGLVEENEVLTAKIGNLESTVSFLKSEMSQIMKKDEDIRLVFDLPPLDADLREVGVGGQIMSAPPVSSELKERTWLVEEDIEKIRRQLDLENASFEQLLDQVKEKRAYLDHMPTISPCDGFMTRGFGMHNDPFTGSYQPHNGVDIAAPKGTPVYATAAGTVVGSSYQSGLGNTIVVNHGNEFVTYYGHLSKIKVAVGKRVERGVVIGLVGSTGYSTGPHLHYEVRDHNRAVDPSKYIIKTILAIR
ncbi:MAG: hypothetical protein A2W25_16360 [candidate division Zixibacteria bacterium RBG_16_53_22]|nr:MAG: hypothetical protein A2W25_16360 [candidate division Zixibacteria bacterium RBG_16_53_22]